MSDLDNEIINNIKKLLKRDIRECFNQYQETKGDETNIGKLSGSKRRHLASLSGRENEAKRILNYIESLEDIK